LAFWVVYAFRPDEPVGVPRAACVKLSLIQIPHNQGLSLVLLIAAKFVSFDLRRDKPRSDPAIAQTAAHRAVLSKALWFEGSIAVLLRRRPVVVVGFQADLAAQVG